MGINDLVLKRRAELAVILRGLSAGITTLNLSYNGMEQKNISEREVIFKALPMHITTLRFEFYRKAACDRDLKPQVEDILWFMRTCRSQHFPVILETLEPFKLSPMLTTYRFFQQDLREKVLGLADQSDTPIDLSQIRNVCK